MSLSLDVWGYVEARGRAAARNNPKSTYNARSFHEVLGVAQAIDNLPADFLREGFTREAVGESCLQAIVFEREPVGRHGFERLLDEMGGVGTLVVPSISVLISADTDVSRNVELLDRLLDSRIALVPCDDPPVGDFVSCKEVSFKQLDNFVMQGVRRLAAVEAMRRGLLSHKTGDGADYSNGVSDHVIYRYAGAPLTRPVDVREFLNLIHEERIRK